VSVFCILRKALHFLCFVFFELFACKKEIKIILTL
jgi:hypothetical protein